VRVRVEMSLVVGESACISLTCRELDATDEAMSAEPQSVQGVVRTALIPTLLTAFDGELERRSGSTVRRGQTVRLIGRMAVDYRWNVAADVTRDDMRDHLTRLVRAGRKSATHNDNLKKLRLWGRFLHDEGYLPVDPSAGLTFVRNIYESGSRPLSREELRALFAHLRDQGGQATRRLDLYQLMLFSALRASETRRLRVGDIDHEHGGIALRAIDSKTGHARWIKLPEEVMDSLVRYTSGRASEDPIWSPFTRRETFKIDCSKAGISPAKVGYNSLRKSFVQFADHEGWSAMQIAKVTGHRDPGAVSKILYRHYFTPQEKLTLSKVRDSLGLGASRGTVADENPRTGVDEGGKKPYLGVDQSEAPMVAANPSPQPDPETSIAVAPIDLGSDQAAVGGSGPGRARSSVGYREPDDDEPPAGAGYAGRDAGRGERDTLKEAELAGVAIAAWLRARFGRGGRE